MKWEERVNQYLNESDPQRREGGYKAMATRLSRDLNKRISPEQVKKYLRRMEKRKVVGDIKRRAGKAADSSAYEWKTKYKILRGHFT